MSILTLRFKRTTKTFTIVGIYYLLVLMEFCEGKVKNDLGGMQMLRCEDPDSGGEGTTGEGGLLESAEEGRQVAVLVRKQSGSNLPLGDDSDSGNGGDDCVSSKGDETQGGYSLGGQDTLGSQMDPQDDQLWKNKDNGSDFEEHISCDNGEDDEKDDDDEEEDDVLFDIKNVMPAISDQHGGSQPIPSDDGHVTFNAGVSDRASVKQECGLDTEELELEATEEAVQLCGRGHRVQLCGRGHSGGGTHCVNGAGEDVSK